jgi:hypothetical protein
VDRIFEGKPIPQEMAELAQERYKRAAVAVAFRQFFIGKKTTGKALYNSRQVPPLEAYREHLISDLHICKTRLFAIFRIWYQSTC